MKEKYFDINYGTFSIKCKMYYSELSKVNDVIIACHGFGGSKESSSIKKLAEKTLCNEKSSIVITFDWPCHGEDYRKKLSLSDCDEYLRLVLDYIVIKYKPNNIMGNATSFGGYLMLKYIYEHGNPFSKIVLRCPAVNMYEILFNRIMSEQNRIDIKKKKNVEVGFERKIKIDNTFLNELSSNNIYGLDYSQYGSKILIIHGTSDELIPIEITETFAKNNSIGFITIEGADHQFKSPTKLHEAVLYSENFMFDDYDELYSKNTR